jgi:hypothetical protein
MVLILLSMANKTLAAIIPENFPRLYRTSARRSRLTHFIIAAERRIKFKHAELAGDLLSRAALLD